jgi:CarD family transcriptional regulator
MAKTETLQQFQQGDMVVYPIQGVGRIDHLETRTFKGKDIPYYVICLEAAEMILRVPVNKSLELGIRPIVSKALAEKALKHISKEHEPVPSDWKQRYTMNLDLLKKGGINDIAEVVAKLYHRSKVKELPVQERKLYDDALKLMVDEVSFSMVKSKDEVEQLVFCQLEKE